MKFKLIFLFLFFSFYQQKYVLSTGEQSCEYIVQFSSQNLSGEVLQGVSNLELWWNRNMFNGGKIEEKFFDLQDVSYDKDCFAIQYGNQDIKNQGETFRVTFANKKDLKKLTFILPADFNNQISLNDSISQAVDYLQEPGDYGQFSFTNNNEETIFVQRIGKSPVQINEILLNQLNKQNQICPDQTIQVQWFNCVPEQIKLHNFFENSLSRNWAFWLFIFILMSFFLVSVFQDEKMDIIYHKQEYWSHHAVYSIRHQISGMFWKRQRLALLYIEICAMTLFLALFTVWFTNTNKAVRIIIFPLPAYFFALIFSFLGGLLLTAYQNTYRTYIEETKSAQVQSEAQKNQKLDKFNKNNYRTLLAFYVYCAACCITSNVISILVMKQQSWSDMGWWILSIALAVMYNLCLFNVLYVIMAKSSEKMHTLLKKRGFYYDKDLQEDYLIYFRDDY